MKIAVLLLLLLVRSTSADVDGDGSDDVMTSGALLSDFLSTTAFTVMYYTKSTGSDYASIDCAAGTSIFNDVNSDSMFMGRSGTNGEVACGYIWDDTINILQVGGAMTAGWHHVALRLSVPTLALFVDGTLVNSNESVSAFLNLALSMVMLRSGAVTSPDRVTELKTYNVALSDDEIKRAGVSRLRHYDRTQPTGHWPLTDCPDGINADGILFQDRTISKRVMTGDDGANNTGLPCRASEYISRSLGVQ